MTTGRNLRACVAESARSKNLERLRSRSVSTKRSLAHREFALGIEALERFVGHAPLRRVHERVFGVLALELRASRSILAWSLVFVLSPYNC